MQQKITYKFLFRMFLAIIIPIFLHRILKCCIFAEFSYDYTKKSPIQYKRCIGDSFLFILVPVFFVKSEHGGIYEGI